MAEKKERLVWCLNDLEEQPMEWLWPGRLPAGKLTLVDGDPSQGKSLMTLDLTSRLTTARSLPDGYTPPAPVPVLLVGSEDGIRDTVLPRLRAAEADLRWIHVFAGRARRGIWSSLPCFPDDCDLLRDTLRETAARLVIVDPLMAFLSSRACSLNDQMVRQALGPLARVAEETQAALVLVRHLTKGGRGHTALYRGSGSIAIIGAARMAYLVGSTPADEDLHVLACTKSNLTVPPAALSFRIAGNDQGQAIIRWEGPADYSADDLVASQHYVTGQALSRAKEFLEHLLRAGPCARLEIQQRAQEAGISDGTLRRAKSALGVVAVEKNVDGQIGWYWHLPGVAKPVDLLNWQEEHQRALAKAQEETDELLAQIRAKYADKPVTPLRNHGRLLTP
jgi:hypothetical protein